ncbi:unnamed protein product [Trifolium pratense]|uniref:Uncharacterized protein n=1 Tax=Trifolium pratense TaxID=57577 RepID=A0ACB0IKJ6_TRIPR|nr:unnamed protein product [Trifolium pratense]
MDFVRPVINLDATVKPLTRTMLAVELKLTPNSLSQTLTIDVVMENRETPNVNPRTLHHQLYELNHRYVGQTTTLNFLVRMQSPLPKQYVVELYSSYVLDPAAPRYILEMQVFPVLYNSNENVFLSALNGSGKTICAELAILRNHQEGNMRVVYIAATRSLAHKQCREWKKKFEGGLNLRTVELTGETFTDLKLLGEGQIIVTTSQIWDALSYHWKQRSYIRRVGLFIIDDLHFIGGGQEGYVLERVIVSIRDAIHHQKNIRMVAMSTSATNAEDIGEWIGADSNGIFNFPITARPVPLKVSFRDVEFYESDDSFSTRFKCMARITDDFIRKHGNYGEHIIVYVPTRDHVQTAVEALAELREPFSLQEKDTIAAYVLDIKNAALKSVLSLGVSFLHESLDDSDKEVVVDLFNKGLIKLCVASSYMAWEESLLAHLVVVMGTQFNDYDGPSYSDLDIFKMMGKAGRHSNDGDQKVFIFCPPNKRKHYQMCLNESWPIESCLQHNLDIILNSEIVAGIVESVQDGINCLAKTFMCRRLHKNPGYYNFQGVSDEDVANHLTTLVVRAMTKLIASGMVVLNHDENKVSPSNLGRISSENYINYETIEIFSTRLTQNSDLTEVLETLCLASEFDALPIRRIFIEEEEMRKLITQQRFPHPNQQVTDPQLVTDPHVKTNALLQAHLSRLPLTSVNLAADQRNILLSLDRLLVGLMKFIRARHWATLLPRAIEVNQMIVQAIWHDDSHFLQLPHLTRELVAICNENNIHNFNDWKTMENRVKELLKLTISQWSDITCFIERSGLPLLKYRISEDAITIGGQRTIDLMLSCKRKSEEIVIRFPYYPSGRRQSWWILLFDAQDQLLTVEFVSSWTSNTTTPLRFQCPVQAENATYNLMFVSESIKGVSVMQSFIVNGWAVG